MLRRAPALSVALLGVLTGCNSPPRPEARASETPPASKADPKPAPEKPPEKAPPPTITVQSKSLYVRLGKEEAITAVVDELLARATANPAIAKRFSGVNVPGLRKGLIALIGQATGGPQVYKGADMKTAHAGMGITNAEFDALAGDLVGALDKLKVPAREKDELLALIGPMRKDIVEAPPTAEQRIARVEAKLARIESKLDQVLKQLERGTPRPSEAPPPPRPAAKPPALKQDFFTADEKKLAAQLVERYARGGQAEAGAQGRDDLIGQRLPISRFLSSTGEVIDLEDFAGKKKVVLVILRGFAGQVCLHCSTQTLALIDAADEFKKKNAELILVYPGEADAVPLFIEAVKSLREGITLPFPIVLDVDLAAVRAFMIEGSKAKPTSMVLDDQGFVRWAYVGKQPQDRPSAADLLKVVDRLPKSLR